jgi:hypothetical protein
MDAGVKNQDRQDRHLFVWQSGGLDFVTHVEINVSTFENLEGVSAHPAEYR